MVIFQHTTTWKTHTERERERKRHTQTPTTSKSYHNIVHRKTKRENQGETNKKRHREGRRYNGEKQKGR